MDIWCQNDIVSTSMRRHQVRIDVDTTSFLSHVPAGKCVRTVIKHHLRPIISYELPGRVAQSVGHLTCKSGVLGSIPGLATYFRFSFRFFKKDSCQLLAKVCARSTG